MWQTKELPLPFCLTKGSLILFKIRSFLLCAACVTGYTGFRHVNIWPGTFSVSFLLSINTIMRTVTLSNSKVKSDWEGHFSTNYKLDLEQKDIRFKTNGFPKIRLSCSPGMYTSGFFASALPCRQVGHTERGRCRRYAQLLFSFKSFAPVCTGVKTKCPHLHVNIFYYSDYFRISNQFCCCWFSKTPTPFRKGLNSIPLIC